MKFSESAALKNIRINFRSDSQHQSIVCDPILLKHAIGCLLENAVYFSLEGSLIDLVATGNQDSIIIEVIDFGHGVDKDDMAYVFNPFFSTRADRPGMGLPTAQRIVNQHMGSIELISGYKTGIIARITLPRHNLAD
jgi:two-component system sensor histidine kinase BaeS